MPDYRQSLLASLDWLSAEVTLMVLGVTWLGMIGALIVATIRQRPFRWTFSLRSLLMLMAFAAVVCGLIAWLARHPGP